MASKVTPTDPQALKELATAEAEVHSAISEMQNNTWRVGDALIVFKNKFQKVSHRVIRNNVELAAELKLNLTPQRIGQIKNTAEYFPPELRDSKIDFRVYEEARKLNVRTKAMSIKALAAFVKTNPSRKQLMQKMPPLPNANATRETRNKKNKFRAEFVVDRYGACDAYCWINGQPAKLDEKKRPMLPDEPWIQKILETLHTFAEKRLNAKAEQMKAEMVVTPIVTADPDESGTPTADTEIQKPVPVASGLEAPQTIPAN